MSGYGKSNKSRPFADGSSLSKSKSLADRYEKSSELLAPVTIPPDAEDVEIKQDKDLIEQNREGNTERTKKEESEDANMLGAKLLKAELMGDEELIKSLKFRLEAAQKKADEVKKENKKQIDEHEINGMLNPYKSSRQKKHKKHHKHQNREPNEEVARIMKKGYKGPGSDDERQYIKKQKKEEQNKSAGHDSGKRLETSSIVVEKCHYCFDNAQKHLIVSIGKYSYLSLPINHSLTEGNCLIAPINHCSSSVTCDEEVWAEIQQFKRALVRMFEKKRMDCVFIEHYSIERKYLHLTIECIPLEMNVANMAPIYFKKAINESESEWATNKNIVNLKEKDLRNTIPRNMPYFAVNFGMDEGYAHVIENDDNFPDHFAKEVIGGILDLDPLVWRSQKKDEFHVQSKKVIDFLKWWEDYDFNKDSFKD